MVCDGTGDVELSGRNRFRLAFLDFRMSAEFPAGPAAALARSAE
jgi:hypothetical protein